MIRPDLETFRRKSLEGNLIPVWREMLADMETPVSAFRKIAGEGKAFLLESVEQGENLGRYSFLGSDPEVVFRCKGRRVRVTTRGEEEEFTVEGRPLDVLRERLAAYKPVVDPDLPPFTGGAVGYVGYDMVRQWEELPDSNPDDLDLADAFFCLTDTLVAFDHVKHRMVLISNAHVTGDVEEAYREAVGKIDRLYERLRVPLAPSAPSGRMGGEEDGEEEGEELVSNFTREEFEKAVVACKEYIAAGDVFQVVISQRFEREYSGDPFDLYRALRAINPSPYMYYLHLDDLHIAGSSPEIMIRYQDGEVCVRPLAGTRRRGRTPEEDLALEKELLADPKERAEHIMLLDLGRNDVGRVSEYGSVCVDQVMTIERYSHVMHIMSNVTGRIRPEFDAFDVLEAGFPAGTVSGAPKIRAMEIIDEMENVRRGPYAGSVGYMGFDGNCNQAITIRTIVMKGGKVYVQAGAGIVADSVPALEYKETRNKARGMLKAVDFAERGLE